MKQEILCEKCGQEMMVEFQDAPKTKYAGEYVKILWGQAGSKYICDQSTLLSRKIEGAHRLFGSSL